MLTCDLNGLRVPLSEPSQLRGKTALVRPIWLCLCPVQLTRKRYRAEQGMILSCPASNTGHNPPRNARLATWFRFFPGALQHQVRRLAVKMEREKLLLSAMPEIALQILLGSMDASLCLKLSRLPVSAAIRSRFISGHTRKKAISFYMAVVEARGMALPSHLAKAICHLYLHTSTVIHCTQRVSDCWQK